MLCLLLLLLSGCAKAQSNTTEEVVVDSALLFYFDKFHSDIGVDTSNISGAIIALKHPTVGNCVTYDDNSKTINIDKSFWDKSTSNEREEVVYHELGHCAMGLKHDDRLDSDNCPLSIMYFAAFGGNNCYAKQIGYYFNELVSKRISK